MSLSMSYTQAFPSYKALQYMPPKKANKIIMTLSVPSSVSLISQVIFRRDVNKMTFKINIRENLKEMNKP